MKWLWTKDEIDELLDRLSKLKDALDTHILYAILRVFFCNKSGTRDSDKFREHQDIQLIYINARFDRLD